MEIGSTENLKSIIENNLNLTESEKGRFFEFIDGSCEKHSISTVTFAAMACLENIPWSPSKREKESFFGMMEDALKVMTEGREE